MITNVRNEFTERRRQPLGSSAMSKAPPSETAMGEDLGRKAFGKWICEEEFDGFDFNPDDMLIELPESVLVAHVDPKSR